MTRQHQVDVTVGQRVGAPSIRIVLQQYLEITVIQATICTGKVAPFLANAVPKILGTNQHHLLFTTLDEGIVIVEQMPACCLLQVTQGLAVCEFGLLIIPRHIIVIVVVAQDGENAIRSMQCCQQIAIGKSLIGLTTHQVTRETDHIGMQGIDGIDLFLNNSSTAVIGAQVGITPLHNAVTVKDLGQTVELQFHLTHLERARSDNRTPPHHAEG